jgi:superfamily II DNA/RNA helicase
MDPRFYTVESLNEEKEEEKRWCQDVLVKLCHGSGITCPSRIQVMAWPKILQKHHPACIIANQTGPGKSYAYAIPLILKMKLLQRNTTTSAITTRRAKNAPNILIITSTSELASLLYNVCIKLCKHVPFQTELILLAPIHPHQTDNALITTTTNNTSLQPTRHLSFNGIKYGP